MMKPLSYVFTGLVGGALALGGSFLLNTSTAVQTETIVGESNPSQEKEAKDIAYQLTSNPQTQPKAPIDFSVAAEKVTPSVVNVTSITRFKPKNSRERMYMDLFGTPDENKGTGSGVILSNKGYIVTNNHVIEGASEVEVTLFDKRKYKATVVGTDPSTDLAVLKVDARNLPVIDMSANSDDTKIGQWVLAVGNPFELNFTVTAGIISAKGRNINILGNRQRSIESFIQTDAAVNPGNSGGALVNTAGQLIGINTAIATPTGTYAGYSFAVPINLVKKVVGDLMEHGEVKRGYLGVLIQDVNSDFAKDKNLNVTQGVYVQDVLDGGSAKSAGIESGDVILAVDGVSTKSVHELQEQIGSRNIGDAVTIRVQRDEKQQNISMRLREAQ